MPALFEEGDVSVDKIEHVLKEFYNLELASKEPLKISQNHTYKAVDPKDNSFYSVRITPDKENKHWENKLQYVCSPIKVKKEGFDFVARYENLTVVVSLWAKGEALNFPSYTFMTDKSIVSNWGKFFGQFHLLSKEFTKTHPEVSKRIQLWDSVHDEILKGSDIHEKDVAAALDPNSYGVLHGDLNMSNFFYVKEEGDAGSLSVFDFDQVQNGWFLFDLAQAEITALMLSEAGALPDGKRVPEANHKQFEDWLVEGYESVKGIEKVDREMLTRMVKLRKDFYYKFCKRALNEKSVPEGFMKVFIEYVMEKWFKEKIV